MRAADSPLDLQWIEGDLPDVHTVPPGCRIIAWLVNWYPGGPESEDWQRVLQWWKEADGAWETIHGSFCRVETVAPYGNNLNPLRWVDSSCHPLGRNVKAKYWAWLYHPLFIGKNLGGLQ